MLFTRAGPLRGGRPRIHIARTKYSADVVALCWYSLEAPRVQWVAEADRDEICAMCRKISRRRDKRLQQYKQLDPQAGARD